MRSLRTLPIVQVVESLATSLARSLTEAARRYVAKEVWRDPVLRVH